MLRRSTAPMTLTTLTLTLLLLIAAALSTGASAQRSATGLASRLTKRPGSSSSSLSSSSSGGSTKSSAESDSESGESSSFQWEELAGTPGSGIGALMALVAGGYYALFVSQSSHPRREVVKFGAHDDEEEDEEEIVIEDDARMDRGFLKNVEIGFSDIRMTLKQKKKKKEDRIILDGSIRGKARPGRMLAIMGPSGSGKSTLVHALAGRIKDSSRVRLHGSRYVNDEPVAGDSQLPSAFIEQDVTFFPHMTVKETLDFRVELRLGKKLGRSARDDVVHGLMEQLGLTGSANTVVGNAKIRGLSGGERKRLSIACEMISSPPVIFLDEPTSGLDSYQASQVIETLRALADSGKTVVAVIHQPSQRVFSMFDDLLLITEGRLMYYGEVSAVRDYMKRLGYGCENETGTAEHVLECVSRVSNGGGEEQRRSAERIERLATEAKNAVARVKVGPSDGNGNGNGDGDAQSSSSGGTASAAATNVTAKKQRKRRKKHFEISHRSGANAPRQFKLLLARALEEVLRGKGAIVIKTVQQVTVAIIYGGIYHLGNNQASIMDRIGLLSLVAIGAMNMATAGTIRSFPREKAIVAREISDGLYATLPYFLAKAISEIPLVGVFQAIFSAILYPLTGLQRGKFRTFLGLTTLHTVASMGAGLLVGSISPNSDVALALFPPLVVLNIIFDGKNISEENTPRLLRWIPKVGLIKWGFEGLAVNEFTGLTFEEPKFGQMRRGPPVATTGREALERFGLGTRTVGDAVRAQVNIICACWLLSWLGLTLTSQKYQVMLTPMI